MPTPPFSYSNLPEASDTIHRLLLLTYMEALQSISRVLTSEHI